MSALLEVFLTRGLPGVIEELEAMYQAHKKAEEDKGEVPQVPPPALIVEDK